LNNGRVDILGSWDARGVRSGSWMCVWVRLGFLQVKSPCQLGLQLQSQRILWSHEVICDLLALDEEGNEQTCPRWSNEASGRSSGKSSGKSSERPSVRP
jgi:hypothetical protein